MPERRNTSDVPERIERLNRALDRVAAGQPAPVLDDPELRDLVDLATQVRQALPADMPDPGFRADLKSQLLAGNWDAQRRSTVARKHRFPYPAAVGAIAAVFVAAVAVGTLAIWLNNDNVDDAGNVAGAGQTLSANPTQAVALATGTSGVATNIALAATQESRPADTARSQAPTTASGEPSTPAQNATTPSSGNQPTPTFVSATATGAANPTATSDEGPSLAGIPPVDAAHLEPGPVPAADGGGGPPSTAVAVTLDTNLPDLGDSAAVYTLVPPDIDPTTLMDGVAATLGIDGPVVKATDARNNVEYRADGSNGATFVWVPETGGFTFSLPDLDAEIKTPVALTAEVVAEHARAWLRTIGYPAEGLSATPLTEQASDGSWSIQISTADVPLNSYGHPLGVIITVNAAGVITGGTGFWLTLHSEEDAPLLSADDAWEALVEHEGYWTGGGIASEGGEYAVDSLSLGYTLTSVDGTDKLIYQPTLIAEGDFTAPNGDESRLTVYLQATK